MHCQWNLKITNVPLDWMHFTTRSVSELQNIREKSWIQDNRFWWQLCWIWLQTSIKKGGIMESKSCSWSLVLISSGFNMVFWKLHTLACRKWIPLILCDCFCLCDAFLVASLCKNEVVYLLLRISFHVNMTIHLHKSISFNCLLLWLSWNLCWNLMSYLEELL